MKRLKIKKIKLLDKNKVNEYKLNNQDLNLIDINFNQKKVFQKFQKVHRDLFITLLT